MRMPCASCVLDLCPHLCSSSAPREVDVKKGQMLKEEGNALVKKGEHKKAIEKYGESLKHNPAEVTTYTNRWGSTPAGLEAPPPQAPPSTLPGVCVCAGLCATCRLNSTGTPSATATRL